eukprot:2656305-Alexandrium_andersonii.AAC.1
MRHTTGRFSRWPPPAPGRACRWPRRRPCPGDPRSCRRQPRRPTMAAGPVAAAWPRTGEGPIGWRALCR